MPKATVIGKADEGNLQVRLDEGSGSRRNKDPKGQPESQRSRILRACKICSTSTLREFFLLDGRVVGGEFS
mgnify:CR=1 FL=1